MKSLTLHFLVMVFLCNACGGRWLGVPMLPVELSGSSASLLLADWIVGQYRTLDPWTIELWLLMAGAAWLIIATGKLVDEVSWSRPRDLQRRIASPRLNVVQSVRVPKAQDLIDEMTHEEWRTRVFGKRPVAAAAQVATVESANMTG